MRKFDLTNTIVSLAQSAADDAFDDVDQSLADVLLYGWSTSYTNVYGKTETATCPDSAALFSASHSNPITSNTFSNIITLKTGTIVNPPISRQAIVDARVTAATYKDPEGKTRPSNLDTLLVAPAKTDLANRIIYSSGVQGTSNIDTNPLNGRVTVKEWPRLSADSASTDKSSYWFIKIKNLLGFNLAQQTICEP